MLKRNKTLNLVTLILIIIIISGMVVAEVCYQETANVSTACGGLSTGTYALSGTWGGEDPDNLYDEDYATGAARSSATGTSYLYINYTQPSNATNSSIWQVKDSVGIRNLTIPDQCDLATYQLRGQSTYSAPNFRVYWACYNSTAWVDLYSNAAAAFNRLYEEGMYWNTEAVSDAACDSTTIVLNCTNCTIYGAENCNPFSFVPGGGNSCDPECSTLSAGVTAIEADNIIYLNN